MLAKTTKHLERNRDALFLHAKANVMFEVWFSIWCAAHADASCLLIILSTHV